ILRRHLSPDRVSPSTFDSLIDALSGFLSEQVVWQLAWTSQLGPGDRLEYLEDWISSATPAAQALAHRVLRLFGYELGLAYNISRTNDVAHDWKNFRRTISRSESGDYRVSIQITKRNNETCLIEGEPD